MSDFDREAEREKLREKYERDKQKREASERMSELLLQGATMTNRHCPDCQSPVFRYDGRQFCPTCEREVTDEEDESADTDAETQTGNETAEGSPESKSPEQGAQSADRVGRDGQTAASGSNEAESGHETETGPRDETPRTDPTEPGRDSPPSNAETDDKKQDSPAGRVPRPTGDRRPARVQPPARSEDERDERRRTDPGTGAAKTATSEFQDAEASLKREIGALTRQAEETRDIGRKRDLLAAAREAAETLQVVRRL